MNDQQKKLAAGGGFAVLAALILYFELRDPGVPPPVTPAPVQVTAASAAAATTPAMRTPGPAPAKGTAAASQQLDPTLHMGAMLLTEDMAYTGTGRNIFAGTSETPQMATVPKAIAPARPKVISTTFQTAAVPQGPPPIDLKFFGTATHGAGRRQAFLLRGDDVFLASAGEIVQRRYRVISVAPNSVVIEDLLNNNRQTLPLTN